MYNLNWKEIRIKRQIKFHYIIVSESYQRWLEVFWGKVDYNPGHNVLALFNNSAHVRITTSKTILDIDYNKFGTRVAEQLKVRKY